MSDGKTLLRLYEDNTGKIEIEGTIPAQTEMDTIYALIGLIEHVKSQLVDLLPKPDIFQDGGDFEDI